MDVLEKDEAGERATSAAREIFGIFEDLREIFGAFPRTFVNSRGIFGGSSGIFEKPRKNASGWRLER